jgi:nickel-type superoxide dismutase maturation protease
MSLAGRVASLFPLARYQVEGGSMLPDVSAGERVLVNKAAYWLRRPSTGDLVVLRDPRDRHRLLLKRLDAPAGDDSWNVLGANAGASTDSRTFGPVDRGLLVGKVLLRY